MKQIISIILLTLLLGACSFPENAETNEETLPTTWDKIKSSGKLVAVTEYNSTDHFIYRGRPMGFQYELLQKLSKKLGVKLEIISSKNLDDSFSLLKKGKCDLIAINLTITQERQKNIDFTHPIYHTRQVLVQKKPKGWRKMNSGQYEKHLVRSLLDLAGQEVYVPSKTSFVERLKNLSGEIGDTIYIRESGKCTSEEIIERVVEGTVKYTVCDENIAKANATYHSDIDIQTGVSFNQKVAWGIPKGADSLKYHLNQFIKNSIHKRWFKRLYNKYYTNPKVLNTLESNHLSVKSGSLSPYDDAIKQHSKIIGWHWLLIASVIYQESRFNPNVTSWAGASGLMQLMPRTAERFGISENAPPSDNIKAGVEFLRWLDKQLTKQVPDSNERVKFVLASYNIGLGHILDAIRLTKKHGRDTSIWNNNVAYFLQQKSKPEFYQDSVVKYGYCRGLQACKYVSEIMHRYQEYDVLID